MNTRFIVQRVYSFNGKEYATDLNIVSTEWEARQIVSELKTRFPTESYTYSEYVVE